MSWLQIYIAATEAYDEHLAALREEMDSDRNSLVRRRNGDIRRVEAACDKMLQTSESCYDCSARDVTARGQLILVCSQALDECELRILEIDQQYLTTHWGLFQHFYDHGVNVRKAFFSAIYNDDQWKAERLAYLAAVQESQEELQGRWCLAGQTWVTACATVRETRRLLQLAYLRSGTNEDRKALRGSKDRRTEQLNAVDSAWQEEIAEAINRQSTAIRQARRRFNKSVGDEILDIEEWSPLNIAQEGTH